MTMFFVSSIWFEPSSAVTSTWPAAAMRACADERVDLVLLEQELDTLGVAVDAFLLERLHLGKIELRLAHRHAHGGKMGFGVLERIARRAERLRRNAADVQAGAAMGLALLDNGGLEAELRCADGAHIAAGPVPMTTRS